MTTESYRNIIELELYTKLQGLVCILSVKMCHVGVENITDETACLPNSGMSTTVSKFQPSWYLRETMKHQ